MMDDIDDGGSIIETNTSIIGADPGRDYVTPDNPDASHHSKRKTRVKKVSKRKRVHADIMDADPVDKPEPMPLMDS